jgi:2-polyprenyl-3-methyl-5-hydroxy-6-metoxy-1,4-benzoquinol methylase
MIKEGKYIGTELGLFENAHHWKNYFKSFLSPYLKGSILEVGAGIGGSTISLCDGTQDEWICLEPDLELAQEIEVRKKSGQIPPVCKIVTSYLSELPVDHKFDSILYLDVIEHIENDAEELKIARDHLKPGGVLIILVPAHQFLYSPFDKKIGHFRRYNRTRLEQAIPASLKKITVRYLDSVGLLASMSNKMLLKSNMPTLSQIKFWDNYMVPFSKLTDRLCFFNLGKSVMGIWQNPA